MKKRRRMKKWKSIRRMLSLFLICSIFVLFVGCNSMTFSSVVRAKGLLSGDEWKMEISCRLNEGDYLAYGCTGFTTTASAERIYKRASGKMDVDPIAFPGMILLKKSNGDGTIDHFLLGKYTSDDNRFYLRNMGVSFYNIEGKSTVLLFPLHLFQDMRLSTKSIGIALHPELLDGMLYECEFQTDLDDIYDFYRESGWYEVEKNDELLIIQGYAHEPTLHNEETEGGNYELDLLFPISVEMKKIGNRPFVKFSSMYGGMK